MEESVIQENDNMIIGNKTSKEVISSYSGLALAYIGDSIYDLLVKKYFVMKSNMQPEKYHKIVTSIVSANAQSSFINYYMDKLTEEEQDVFRRGRNSSPHTKAKNASLQNYLEATGMEAVLGFLYLSGNEERLLKIVEDSIIYKEEIDNK